MGGRWMSVRGTQHGASCQQIEPIFPPFHPGSQVILPANSAVQDRILLKPREPNPFLDSMKRILGFHSEMTPLQRAEPTVVSKLL